MGERGQTYVRSPDDEVTGQVKLAKKSVKSMVSGD